MEELSCTKDDGVGIIMSIYVASVRSGHKLSPTIHKNNNNSSSSFFSFLFRMGEVKSVGGSFVLFRVRFDSTSLCPLEFQEKRFFCRWWFLFILLLPGHLFSFGEFIYWVARGSGSSFTNGCKRVLFCGEKALNKFAKSSGAIVKMRGSSEHTKIYL